MAGSSYTVKSGDTLSKIAAANGTTVAKLIAANPFLKTNPKYNGGSSIFSGTVLTLPSGNPATAGLDTAVGDATTGNGNTNSGNGNGNVSTQAATNVDKLDKATLQAKFGIAAGIIGADDSLSKVLDKILADGITSEALMTQMIQETLWYKNQTDKQRAFVYAKETNPGQFAADLQLNASNIVKQFMGNGIQITAAQAIDYAQQLMQSVIIDASGKVVRYDQEFLNKIMANSIDFSKKSTIGGKQIYNLTGKLETVANELYKRAYDYGFDSSLSNERFAGWFENSIKGLISGTTNAEDIDNELQKQAMSMFPGLTNQLSQGQTLRAAADPWLNAIAGVWEVDPTTLNLNDPFVQRALNYTDEKGNVSTMNLYDTKKMARRSPNSDFTSWAKEEKTGIANTILRDFGFLG
jgi:murein DD-endopeptidase MepM/ murein hydrolase activator NlpD